MEAIPHHEEANKAFWELDKKTEDGSFCLWLRRTDPKRGTKDPTASCRETSLLLLHLSQMF